MSDNEDAEENVLELLIAAVLVENDVEMADTILSDDRSLLFESKSPLLHAACSKGSPNMVQILIKHGADVLGCDARFRRPIHCAVQGCEASQRIAVVKILMHEHEKNKELRRVLHARDKQGYTCMHTASATPNNSAVIQLLLSFKASVDIVPHPKFPNLKSPLILAVMSSSVETLRALLKAKAYPNAQSDHPDSIPLICAAKVYIYMLYCLIFLNV